MSLGGEVTGKVSAGRLTYEVGSPAGTRAFLATGTTSDSTILRQALREPETTPADAALDGAEEALDEMGSALGHIERALDLFTTLAQGKVFDKKMLKEVDALVGVLERLDREKRHRDALRLARVLAALLALLMRWVALVETLRVALRAAESLGDAPGIAWARHELGTFSLGAEDAAAAHSQLREALAIREKRDDELGAEVTRHNLAMLRRAFPGFDEPTGGGGLRRLVVAGAAALGLLLVAGGVAIGMALADGDSRPEAGASGPGNIPTVDTEPPEVEITESPNNPTEERSASFAFEADEEIETFECRLDDAPFEECVSPKNYTARLDVGPHRFRVRATDYAGNTGAAISYRWVIEQRVGPTVTIVGRPKALTNQVVATFSLTARGAARLECRVDDEQFACTSPFEVTVEEGDHTFVAQAFDAEDNPGPEAPYDWTVDTTPPTVLVDGVEGLEVAFHPSESGSVVECVILEGEEFSGDPVPEPVEVDRFEPCKSPVSVPDAPGYYIVDLAATDPAGNLGAPTREILDRELD